jgi:hypothetical protein
MTACDDCWELTSSYFELCNWLNERNDLETETTSIAAEKIIISSARPAEAS